MRAAVAAKVADSGDEGIAALRAAITIIFSWVVVQPSDGAQRPAGTPDGAPYTMRPGIMLTPIPRPEALAHVAPSTVVLADGSRASIELPVPQVALRLGEEESEPPRTSRGGPDAR